MFTLRKGSERILEEFIVENFPNLGKEIATQVEEAQRVPYRINPRRNTLRHNYHTAAAAKSLQSCPTLCDPTDGSPPGSPVPGIL